LANEQTPDVVPKKLCKNIDVNFIVEKFRKSLNMSISSSVKGVLNPNFLPFSFELKKLRFFEINFELGSRFL